MTRFRRGFTLVELLVVIAIIAILVLMLLPAINGMRESARRTQCINRMSQLIIGVHSHEMAHGYFPTGVRDTSGPIVNQEQGLHQSWTISLLPFIEEDNVYRMIDHEQSVYAKSNQAVRDKHLTTFVCPSSPMLRGALGHSNYAAVHHDVEAPINDDNDGVFFLNSRISQDDVTDGSRYTLFLGEKILERGDLGWMSGTRATLRNTGTPINQTDLHSKATFGMGQPALDGFGTDDVGIEDALESDENNTTQEETEKGALPEDVASDDGQATESDDRQQDDDETAPTEDPIEADQQQAEIDDDVADLAATDSSEKPGISGAVQAGDPWAAAKKAGLYVGGFGSFHKGGSVFAFGDGHVRLIDNGIDFQVYQNMGGRADGKVIDGRLFE